MMLDLPRRARPVRGGGPRIASLAPPLTTAYARDGISPRCTSGCRSCSGRRALGLIYAFDLDWRAAHALFDWEGYRWALRDHPLTETLLHRGGHALPIAAWVALLAAWLLAHRRYRPLRGAITGVLASVLLSTLRVSWIKSWSNIDCPWDIHGLGGLRPHLTLWESFSGQRSAWLPRAHCFPAGQASAGYAWVALYFFALRTCPAWRWHGDGPGWRRRTRRRPAVARRAFSIARPVDAGAVLAGGDGRARIFAARPQPAWMTPRLRRREPATTRGGLQALGP